MSFVVDLSSGGDEWPPQWSVTLKDGSRPLMSWREICKMYENEKVDVPKHVRDAVNKHESAVFDKWQEMFSALNPNDE
jgi:hypothetical protein